MSQTKVGEIAITDKGTLVLSVSLPELFKRLREDPLEALWGGEEEASSSPEEESEPQEEQNVGSSEDVPTEEENKGDVEPINPFAKDRNGLGGVIDDGKAKEIYKWLVESKISYANFCHYLRSKMDLAGFPLSEPLIGCIEDGTPTFKKLAARYYSWWLSKKDTDVLKEYNEFLKAQLAERDLTIDQAKEILEGEVIDPAEIPEGVEVSL